MPLKALERLPASIMQQNYISIFHYTDDNVTYGQPLLFSGPLKWHYHRHRAKFKTNRHSTTDNMLKSNTPAESKLSNAKRKENREDTSPIFSQLELLGFSRRIIHPNNAQPQNDDTFGLEILNARVYLS